MPSIDCIMLVYWTKYDDKIITTLMEHTYYSMLKYSNKALKMIVQSRSIDRAFTNVIIIKAYRKVEEETKYLREFFWINFEYNYEFQA